MTELGGTVLQAAQSTELGEAVLQAAQSTGRPASRSAGSAGTHLIDQTSTTRSFVGIFRHQHGDDDDSSGVHSKW